MAGTFEESGSHRHVGETVELADSEDGAARYTARLASRFDGLEYEIVIDRWERCEPQLVIAVGDADILMDAVDDGGRRAIQELAGLVLLGRQSASHV